MSAGDAEEIAQKLDDLWALKSMKLERDTKPFAMRFHLQDEIKAWTPSHVSHFLRVVGLASLATQLHADAPMGGLCFACWLLHLHATVMDVPSDDTRCAGAKISHDTAFKALESKQWKEVHSIIMRSHLSLLMQATKKASIDCSRRYTYFQESNAAKIVEALRHCGLVIVKGLLPKDTDVLEKLKALPSAISETSKEGSCSEDDKTATEGASERLEDKEALGALRGGRKEVFLPLTNTTDFLVTAMMRHQPIISILTQYLRDQYQSTTRSGIRRAGGVDDDDLIMGAASLDLTGEYDPTADGDDGITSRSPSLALDFDSIVLVDADPHGASFEQHLHRDVPLVGINTEGGATEGATEGAKGGSEEVGKSAADTAVEGTRDTTAAFPFGSLAVQIPLVNMPASSGSIRFCPRTHTGPRYSVWKGLMCNVWNRLDAGLKWGEIAIYDSSVVHKGLKNKGDNRRPVLYLNYRAIRQASEGSAAGIVAGGLADGYSSGNVPESRARRVGDFRGAWRARTGAGVGVVGP
jgi:hypothetical protein